MHAPRLRSVLIGEHLEMLGVADFVACIDIDTVSETGPTSGLKFPRFSESDFKNFGALRRRRSPQRVDSLVMPASENLHKGGHRRTASSD
jgi:hypothetical protein